MKQKLASIITIIIVSCMQPPGLDILGSHLREDSTFKMRLQTNHPKINPSLPIG